MIDWSRIDELREQIGEEDFAEVVELFLEEVEEVIGRLRTQERPASLEEDLHFLKGSALNLGFDKFSQACQVGESMAAAGQSHEVALDAILTTYDTSKVAFLAKNGP